ncbi:MAG TPA: hypothetical protein VHR88_09410 [Solirubrobacteraceae bacterium]|nr:hypothetical protein [Solirubrobacteraceae bacterium]
MTAFRPLLVGAAFGAGALVGRASASSQLRFARMTGSSIAGPDAAGWITDFLNSAYYRRDPARRDVDDLRLASAIVTTRWHRLGHRRLRLGDAVAFHRAFGRERFIDGARSARGTLDRGQLLDGAGRLFGPWFAGAYADSARGGWGIVFESAEERSAYDPEVRLRLARLGSSTPPEAPGREQTWHTYPAVQMPSSDAVIAALGRPETWPDYASALGRFTPLRRGELAGQTFEIEVVAGAARGRPIFTRGYVTITTLVSREDPEALRRYIDELNDGLARFGRDEPPAVGEDAQPVLAFDLTTHEGHFLGRSKNRLVLFEQQGRAFVRAAGTWDPMPWHIDQAYRRAGRDAQHAFWGQGADPEESMLHQIALRAGTAGT